MILMMEHWWRVDGQKLQGVFGVHLYAPSARSVPNIHVQNVQVLWDIDIYHAYRYRFDPYSIFMLRK